MYTEAGAEAVVVEVIVVCGPSAQGSEGEVEAELEVRPSKAEHHLRLENESGRVVTDHKGLGAVGKHFVLVELGRHQAALDPEAKVYAIVVKASPTEVDLTEDKAVVAFGAVGVVDQVADGVLMCCSIAVADIALQYAHPEREVGACGGLQMINARVGKAGRSLHPKHIQRRIGDVGVDGRRSKQRRRQ